MKTPYNQSKAYSKLLQCAEIRAAYAASYPAVELERFDRIAYGLTLLHERTHEIYNEQRKSIGDFRRIAFLASLISALALALMFAFWRQGFFVTGSQIGHILIVLFLFIGSALPFNRYVKLRSGLEQLKASKSLAVDKYENDVERLKQSMKMEPKALRPYLEKVEGRLMEMSLMKENLGS